jgi:hypothetical protein
MKRTNHSSRSTGRKAAALLLMIIGGSALLLSLPGALLFVRYQHFVVASIAIVAVTLGWLLYPPKMNGDPDETVAKGRLAGWEMPAALGALLLTGLWGFWSMKVGQWDQWEEKDEAERAKAPAWNHSLDTLEGGMRWEDVRDRLGKEGFRMRCSAVRPGEGMQPGDTHACQTIANQTWGIPARTLSFLFGPEGLRQVRIDYAAEQWPAVKAWFDRLPGFSTGDFGRDQGGNVIVGKMLRTGQVLTSESEHLPNVMVLWQARSMLQQTICRKNPNDPKWNLICSPSSP